MAGAAIRLENVTVVFNRGTPNETVALDSVNLEVPPGDVVVVLGGNGSGKSTLLKVIAGIYRPTQGKVFIDGQDVTKEKDYFRARKLSFVHQDPPAWHRSLAVVICQHGPCWLEKMVVPFALWVETRQPPGRGTGMHRLETKRAIADPLD